MNKILFNLRKRAANFILGDAKNAMTLPQKFLRYGSRGAPIYPGWGDVQMTDQDHYTGYGYGAIDRRSVMVARTAKEQVRTESNQKDFVHPYLNTISSSKTFTDVEFWRTISTYLNLEGVFYLMAIRAFENERRGKVKEFKLLNPYQVRRVVGYTDKGISIGGYIESKGGFVREIPPEMIIDIRKLNPFEDNSPYSPADAAKEPQFNLKTASDYTRNALKHNINAPGIMSTDIQLEEEEFKNFMDRVSKHTKGAPIFGNGSGAVKWESMQSELSKAALKDVNELGRDEAFSVYGVSKTIMQIEQSGVTRDTARVQKELMTELHILPEIQLIIDALNQDYRNNYPEEYLQTKALIVVDNPLSVDYDAKLKDTEVKEKEFDLYTSLVNKGVDNDTAAKYVRGEVELEKLKIKPVEIKEDEKPEDKKIEKEEDNQLKKNQIDQKGLVQQQQGALQNAVVNIEQQLLTNALLRVRKKFKNEIELRPKDVITQQEKNEVERELSLVLMGFYGIVVNLQGQSVMRGRQTEFNLLGFFNFDRDVQSIIKTLSSKASSSHVDTVTQDIYNTAREAAEAGKGLDEVERDLRKKYNDVVSKTRAKTLARSETNRAFTTAQHEADRQFIAQNDLEGRVFKQWTLRSDDPCEFCIALSKEKAIPFDKNFRSLGDEVKVKDQILKVNYLDLEAGNAHPNCSCIYKLIIE